MVPEQAGESLVREFLDGRDPIAGEDVQHLVGFRIECDQAAASRSV